LLTLDFDFQTSFLPAFFNDRDNIHGTGTLAEKVLTSYIHMEGITPAGRHAADQLLSRLRYLLFKEPVAMSVNSNGVGPAEYDLRFDDELLKAADSIIVERRIHGVKPRRDIFDRAVLRCRASKARNDFTPWANPANVTSYPSGTSRVPPKRSVLASFLTISILCCPSQLFTRRKIYRLGVPKFDTWTPLTTL
jgi:hypothetical protein